MEVKYGYSRVKYACDGATSAFAIPFPFLNRSHIGVTVWDTDGNDVTGSFPAILPPGSTITVSPTPPAGYSLLIYRDSSAIGKLVDFTDGTTITERDLDTGYLQAWYTAQEALDEAGSISLSTPSIDGSVADAIAAAEAAAAAAAAAEAAAESAAASAALALTVATDAAASADAAAASAAAAAAAVSGLATSVLLKANNLSDLTDAATARDNLALEDLATLALDAGNPLKVLFADGHWDYLGSIAYQATPAAARSYLGLGTMALESASTYATVSAVSAAFAALGSMSAESTADWLSKAGNLAGLASAATSRTNLGLGALAVLATVDETLLSFTDITTANASITKHGLLPKLPNDATKALLGDGTWGTAGDSFNLSTILKVQVLS